MSLLDSPKAAIPQNPIPYGPWHGSMRSVTNDLVPRGYASGGSNFIFEPRGGELDGLGYWRRRLGQTQKFDTFGASVGLLPANWVDNGAGKGAKVRWAEEFTSESFTDGVPSIAALMTTETIAAGLDDGRFSNLWMRDQQNNLNYTVGSEYSATTYPDPGTIQYYRFVPMWYESGEGGLTRGAGPNGTSSEYAQRFFYSGSRRFQRVGNWTYAPNRYGTPNRWSGQKSSADFNSSPAYATSTICNALACAGTDPWGVTSGDPATQAHLMIDEAVADDATTVIAYNALGSGVFRATFGFSTLTKSPLNQYRIRIRARITPTTTAQTGSLKVETTFNGVAATEDAVALNALTTSWVTYEMTETNTGDPTISNVVGVLINPGGATGDTIQVTWLEITPLGPPGETSPGRLIPSGPFPPTHAGVLVKGDAVTTVFMRPNGDEPTVGINSWRGTDGSDSTNIYEYIDDATPDHSSYIQTTNNDACQFTLSAPSIAPVAGDTVTMRYWGRRSDILANPTLRMDLVEDPNGAATIRATRAATTLATAWTEYAATLTPAEMATVVSWSDLALRFTAASTGSNFVQVSDAYVDSVPLAAASEGGWKGKDRFLWSMAYRFEDDSIWMPCTPRFPNDILPNGFNMFTVDAANPETAFNKITWTHLPDGPHGTKSKVMLRGEKIDSTSDDNLLMNPTDLRVVGEVPQGVYTFDDYSSEDLALVLDPERLLIRYDHMMPPRARYNFAGDMRSCHSYGGQNPGAFQLAPVGRAADYDLEGDDDTTALYGSGSQYFSIQIDPTGTSGLVLTKISAAAVTTTETLAFTTYNTIQKLVDRINLTVATDSGGQWRAQLCPGASGDADCLTSLTPHKRVIASCVVAGQTITVADVGKVGVGALISGTGVTAGAYVTQITSSGVLTFSGTITSGTKTLTFYYDLGDSASSEDWHQRVIGNCLPGFAYFTTSFLGAIDKQAVWMTVANPAQSKSAPNCFSNKIENTFHPPLDAGISQGGAGIGNGFFTPFANKRTLIKNVRDSGTGEDKDYRMVVTNESSGCAAWNTVTSGNGFAVCLAPEGLIATDLEKEALISEAVYVHEPVQRGDFSYENPLCAAAAAADSDGAYASARIMRGALWVNWRASGSHPNRQTKLDFSSGTDNNGIGCLFRKPGQVWGWGLPLVRSMTAMTLGRRTDGDHMYGFNDENAGTTGDGRVDEMEVTEADNLVAIVGSVEFPYERAEKNDKISAQEMTVNHLTPTAATTFIDFYRSYEDDLSTLTLTAAASGTTPVVSDLKMLPQKARAVTNAVRWAFRQTTGSAAELRPSELRLKVCPRYR